MKELMLVTPTAKELKRYKDWAPLFGFSKVSTTPQLDPILFSGIRRVEQMLFIHFPNSSCLQKLQHCPDGNYLDKAKHIAVIQKTNIIAELSLISLGFKGVLNTSASRSEQADVLDKVVSGELAFSSGALSEYILSMDKTRKGNNYHLLDTATPKEKQVLDLACNGLTNDEIAHKLCISINTVKMHLQNIYKKTNVKSRAQLLITFGK